jgi:fluoroquinolone transport system permease protein
MKAIKVSFTQLLVSVKRDAMLFVICFVPLLCGLTFKYFIPFVEKLLTEHFSTASIISPYYMLFDILFSMITPAMFCFVASMIILEETDEHIAGYLYITPLKKGGYLFSRIGIPAITAFIITLILIPLFKLSDLSIFTIFLLAAAGTIQGIIISMLIVSFSSNKLEGMAVAKLSFLMELGSLGPFFIDGKSQFLLSPLPSFWMSKAMVENNSLYFLFTFLISGFWILLITKRFMMKTEKGIIITRRN